MKHSAALASVVLLAVAVPGRAQTARQALTAGHERYLLADYHGALPLIARGLDPGGGAVDQAWLQGVERLADLLLVLNQETLATTWLRWASRLAPEFAVDEDIMPPAVVRAARAARAFVDSTPQDPFVAHTMFEWPPALPPDGDGAIRVAPTDIPITVRIGADQFLRDGESRRLAPGSYAVIASAPGYLPTRLTVEVLPGVTSAVTVNLLPEDAGALYVVARPWGELWVDGQRIGYTGIAAHRVTPGRHTLRLRRDRSPTVDTTVVVGNRQDVRLAWVTSAAPTGDARIDSAFGLLDAGHPEAGIDRLNQLLNGHLPAATAAPAIARQAEALWSLGNKNATLASLRRLVEVDPFYRPPSDGFNPELQALYARVRQATPAIGLQTPADTVISPIEGAVPVQVAVGHPGRVRLLLRLPGTRTRDSLLATLPVDSLATVRIPLLAPDGSVLDPGDYVIEGEVVSVEGSANDLLQMGVERQPTDTIPHQSLIPDSLFRPETRRGPASVRDLLEGLGVGLGVMLVPLITNDRDLGGRTFPALAGLVGAVTVGVHVALKDRTVPIPPNLEYNDALRARWREENDLIVAENARRLRLASLRIRTRRP